MIMRSTPSTPNKESGQGANTTAILLRMSTDRWWLKPNLCLDSIVLLPLELGANPPLTTLRILP